MRREDVMRTPERHRAQTRCLGVKSLAVFGSVARSDDRLDSDVEVLVEFRSPATFDQYMDLKFLLEDLLGRRIDLVTTRGLKPRLRQYVEREMLYVA